MDAQCLSFQARSLPLSKDSKSTASIYKAVPGWIFLNSNSHSNWIGMPLGGWAPCISPPPHPITLQRLIFHICHICPALKVSCGRWLAGSHFFSLQGFQGPFILCHPHCLMKDFFSSGPFWHLSHRPKCLMVPAAMGRNLNHPHSIFAREKWLPLKLNGYGVQPSV